MYLCIFLAPQAINATKSYSLTFRRRPKIPRLIFRTLKEAAMFFLWRLYKRQFGKRSPVGKLVDFRTKKYVNKVQKWKYRI